MDSFKKEKAIKNKSEFSLKISLIIFFYSLLMFLLGLFTQDILYSFGILYPILMLLVIIFFIYFYR